MHRSLDEVRGEASLDWAHVRERDTGQTLVYLPVLTLCSSPFRVLGVEQSSGWVAVVWSDGAVKHGIGFEIGDVVQSLLTLLDRSVSDVLAASESFCEWVGLDRSGFREMDDLIDMTIRSGLRRKQRYVDLAVDWIEDLNATARYHVDLAELVDQDESAPLAVRLRIAELVGRHAATVPPEFEYDEWCDDELAL